MKIYLKCFCSLLLIFLAKTEPNVGKICPDQTQCVGDQSCCEMQYERYGCCPYPNGVCCADKLHCCPEKMRCDDASGRCMHSEEPDNNLKPTWKKTTNNIFNRLMYLLYNMNGTDPEKCSSCDTDSTCCEQGCCNLPNGVCCPNGKKCCPAGSECAFDGQTCMKISDQSSGLIITESASVPIALNNSSNAEIAFPATRSMKSHWEVVPCPGGQYTCPDGSTCCPVGGGRYGCCPMLNATCCSDQKHCCPSGFVCDISHNRCTQNDFKIEAARTLPATKIETDVVVCPGGRIKCPDNTTCCAESQPGEFGCCPYPNAVCCSDKLHCCPGGTSCDMAHMRCVRGAISFPFAVIFHTDE